MTHSGFVFCLQMNWILSDHQHTWNAQLPKAICYKAEQSTRSGLQLLSVLNNESDVTVVMIFKGSLNNTWAGAKRGGMAVDSLEISKMMACLKFYWFSFPPCELILNKHSPLSLETERCNKLQRVLSYIVIYYTFTLLYSQPQTVSISFQSLAKSSQAPLTQWKLKLKTSCITSLKLEVTSKQIVFCITVPQAKSEQWLTLFFFLPYQRYLVVSRTWLVLLNPVLEIRVVLESLCGWTGAAILSLGLTETHRAQFISTSVTQRGAGHNFWITTWNLQEGMTETSAVTTLSSPRLDRAPLTTPHEKARYLGAWSRYCLPLESWVSRENLLSCRT